jgi:hypothetical protein
VSGEPGSDQWIIISLFALAIISFIVLLVFLQSLKKKPLTPEKRRFLKWYLIVVFGGAMCLFGFRWLQSDVIEPRIRAETRRARSLELQKQSERESTILSYTSTITAELADKKTWGTGSTVGPQHPSILRKPYPTELDIEKAIGDPDLRNTTQIEFWSCHPDWQNYMSRHIVDGEAKSRVQVHVLSWQRADWHSLQDPNNEQKDVTILLQASFGPDGQPCRLDRSAYGGTETIGIWDAEWNWSRLARITR